MEGPHYQGELTDENIRNMFRGAADFNYRPIRCAGILLHTYAIDGLTSGADISEYVFQPMMSQLKGETIHELYNNALENVVVNSVAKPCSDLDTAAKLLVNGFCVVLFPGVGAIAFEDKTGEKRGISEPAVENTAKGPKDAFVETVRTNTSLIRRHLRTPDLRIYEAQVGRRSLTNVSVVWIDGLTDPGLPEMLKQRLADIDIDGMLSPSSVEEYITGSRATAFPLLQYTERSDRFCHGLLDGRVGLLVDGLPLGYLAPVDLGYLMNSPEDMGRDYISASWVRLLRYGSLVISLLLPAIYVAAVVFHKEYLPVFLQQIIDESRDHIPYSAGWEVLGLLTAFELLQESGIHLPQSIGQSVSIIGGIVVGTAAVEAGFISPMSLISVSLTGICGFVLPNRDLAAAVRVWRFFLAILAFLGGITGAAIGLVLLLIHLATIRSMGQPYLKLRQPTFLRHRLVKNKYRDLTLKPQDRRKQR